jgi:hypothetical protein
MLSKEHNNIVIFILILILIITLYTLSSKIDDESNKPPTIKRHTIEKKEAFTNHIMNANIEHNDNPDIKNKLVINILRDNIDKSLLKRYNILEVSENNDSTTYTYIQLDEINEVDNPNIYEIKHYKNHTNIEEINGVLTNINDPVFKLMGNSKINCIYTNYYDTIQFTDSYSNYKLIINNISTESNYNKNKFNTHIKKIINDNNIVDIYSDGLSKGLHRYVIYKIDDENSIFLDYFDNDKPDELYNYTNTDATKNLLIVRKDINNSINELINSEIKDTFTTYLQNNLELESLNKMLDNANPTL